MSSDCVLTFAEADDGLRLTLAYMGSEKTLLRPRSLARVITRGEDQVVVPLSEPIKPFMNDVELAALSPKVREVVEASERYWPTAAETALLEKIVERLVADMEYVASGPEAVWPSRMTTLCERFSAAFSYFYRKAPDGTGMPGKQVPLARAFVRDRLVAHARRRQPLRRMELAQRPAAHLLAGTRHRGGLGPDELPADRRPPRPRRVSDRPGPR